MHKQGISQNDVEFIQAQLIKLLEPVVSFIDRILPQKDELQSVELNSGYAQVLELAAVMRASQAFSEETNPTSLMNKLMDIMLEVAGAQRLLRLINCFMISFI